MVLKRVECIYFYILKKVFKARIYHVDEMKVFESYVWIRETSVHMFIVTMLTRNYGPNISVIIVVVTFVNTSRFPTFRCIESNLIITQG